MKFKSVVIWFGLSKKLNFETMLTRSEGSGSVE